MSNTGTTQGVYYNLHDYAGFFRRIIIMAVDGFVLLLACQLLTEVSWRVYPDELTYWRAYYISPWVLAYLYLVILKRSIGTLGYLITRVRIVDMFGNRPSIVRMTGRFIWLLVLPIGFVLDIIWLTGEETRQTLRDKTVGTYVIRKKAKPVGTGKYGIKIMSFMGLCLRLREVEKDSQDSDYNSGKS